MRGEDRQSGGLFSYVDVEARVPRRAAAQRRPCLDHGWRGAAVPQGRRQRAKLCFMGHLLMENRSGLVVATQLTQATGWAEREAASRLIKDLPGRHRITVGADRAYDTADFVAGLRGLNATPHVAQNLSGRASRIDRRTVRHPGYLARQRARKRI